MAVHITRRTSGLRAFVVGALITGVAATVPAGAVEAPALVETSVDSGWSATTEAVAARFDKVLDQAASSVTLEEVGVGEITGWYLGFGQEENTIFLTTTDLTDPAAPAADPLRVDGTDYQVTFHVQGAAPSAPDEVESFGPFTFLVDPDRPKLPVITSPAPVFRQEIHIGGEDQAGTPEITVIELGPADPTTPVETFAGTAADATGTDGDVTATSGISSVELRFFNPSLTPLAPDSVVFSVNLGAEHLTKPGEAETEWSIGVDELVDEGGSQQLTTGLWAVRAVASDNAGNSSAPSKVVQILVI